MQREAWIDPWLRNWRSHMLREVAKRRKPKPTVETRDPHPPILQMLLTGLTPMGCKTPILHSCSKRGDPWTVARQAPLSLGFSRQEHWSGLPFASPGDHPNPGIKPASLRSPALAGRFFTTSAIWETPRSLYDYSNKPSHWTLPI